MANTYYSSLSGMLAASYGLQNASNNISNMQSNGFKRSDLFYSSLQSNAGEYGLNQGVQVKGKSINFSTGSFQETQGANDLALVGQGFFVVRLKNNHLVYTRNGNFSFENGFLVDKHNGGQVQGYNHAGHLVPIHQAGPKTAAGKASSNVFLSGNFVPHETAIDDSNPVPNPTPNDDSPIPPNPVPDPTPQPSPIPNPSDPSKNQKKFDNVIFDLKTIYDTQGKAHTVTLEFKNIQDIPNPMNTNQCNWELERVSCDDISVKASSWQQIQFISNSPGADEQFSKIQFTMGDHQLITVHFGHATDGSDKAVSSKDQAIDKMEPTSISIYQNDGYSIGKQIAYAFDENGQISYQYDNGQIVTGVYLGLARFDDMEHNLVSMEHNFFRTKNERGIHYGKANSDGFDAVVSGKLECSNVDPTTEFANIVVLQRMFQACSQIMDIDKQLIEQLEHQS